MNKEKVHLTFKTDREISELLKLIAHDANMTQPELIEKICRDFIEDLNQIAKEELEKEGILRNTEE